MDDQGLLTGFNGGSHHLRRRTWVRIRSDELSSLIYGEDRGIDCKGIGHVGSGRGLLLEFGEGLSVQNMALQGPGLGCLTAG